MHQKKFIEQRYKVFFILLMFFLIFVNMGFISATPTITWVIPTPSNTSSTGCQVTLLANISDSGGLDTSCVIDMNRMIKGYWTMDFANSSGIYDNSSWNRFALFGGGLSSSNLVTGSRGDALMFDGVNDYLSLGNFNLTTPSTISFWVKPNSSTGKEVILSSDGIENFEISIDSGKLNSNGLLSSTTLSVDNWYHILITANSTGTFLYVNGSYENSTSSRSPIITPANVVLGKSRTNTNFLNGSIDELIIIQHPYYKEGLTLPEILGYYNSTQNQCNYTSNYSTGQQNYTAFAISQDGSMASTYRIFGVSGGCTLPAEPEPEISVPLQGGLFVGTIDTYVSENSDAKGTYQDGTYMWVMQTVSSTSGTVYKYWLNSTYTGTKVELNASYPYGIDSDGSYFYITDYYGSIKRYFMNFTDTGFSFNTAQINVTWNDTQLNALAYDNGILYTHNFKNFNVYKYLTNGTFLGIVPSGTYGGYCQNTASMEVKNGELYLMCNDYFSPNWWNVLYKLNATNGTLISKTNISQGITDYRGLTINSTDIILSYGNLELYSLSGVYSNDISLFEFDGTKSGRGVTRYQDKLWMVGYAESMAYEYYKNGTFIGNSFPVATSPLSIETNGTFFWVGNASSRVYKYYFNGTYTGESFSTLNTPDDLAKDGDYFWILSNPVDAVYKYWTNGTYTGTVFSVGSQATTPRGIAVNTSYIYVSDNGNDEVYAYWKNGTYTGVHFDTNAVGDFLPFGLTTDENYFYLADYYDNQQFGWKIYTYWINNPAISTNISYPPNGYTLATNESIDLNYSVNGYNLDTCWYYVLNSTGSKVLGDNQISCSGTHTTFNISQGEGSYQLFLYANDTNNITNYTNVNFYISINSPAINLITPNDNAWINNKTGVFFNFTATHPINGLSQCILYTNYSGSWLANQTWDSPSNNVMQSVKLNFDTVKKNILWNVWCNDTLNNGGYSINNRTFNIDETPPQGNITNIVTISGSQAVTFYSTSIDDNAGYTCKFSVYNLAGGVEGINNNISFTCNQSFAFSVSGFATYVLELVTTDLAGNQNFTNKSFITYTTTPPPSGGGGGGGEPVVTTGNWTMETEFGGSSYQFTMIQSSSRTKDLVFENLGTTSRTIKLTCEPVSGSRNLCDTIQFEQNTFSLPLQRDVKTAIGFDLVVPSGYDKERYIVNLIGTDEDGNKGIITLTVDVTSYTSITGAITKLFSSTDGGIPYVLFFFLIAFMTGVLANFLIFKPNKIPSAYSILVGLFFGIIFLLLPI